MDYSRLMPNYFKSEPVDDSPLTEEELAELKRERHRHAPKHGPQRVRFISAGQQRRAMQRYSDAQSRKANRRHRRRWMANEAAFQTLRAQINLLDKTPDSGLAPGVIRVLETNYGGVDEARAHLTALVRERIEAAA